MMKEYLENAVENSKVRCKSKVVEGREKDPMYIIKIKDIKKIFLEELGDLAIDEDDSILDYIAEIGRAVNQFD